MSIGAVVCRSFHLFNDFTAMGLAPADTELRVTLQERWNANNAWASEAGVEYAIWAKSSLDLLGGPSLQGDTEATDASGVLVINTAGSFAIGAEVLVAIRKTAAGPSSETVFGLAEETITEV